MEIDNMTKKELRADLDYWIEKYKKQEKQIIEMRLIINKSQERTNKLETPTAFADVVSSFEPQRYSIELIPDFGGSYAGYVGCEDGEFVRYQDIKHLLGQH